MKVCVFQLSYLKILNNFVSHLTYNFILCKWLNTKIEKNNQLLSTQIKNNNIKNKFIYIYVI